MKTLFGLLLVTAAATAGPPNVVMILGDDQHYGDYGFMGSTVVRTPHLDKLASEGMVFRRGYVPTSLCRASLATMVTGLWPHQHRITSNDPPLPKGVLATNAAKTAEYQRERAKMVAIFEESPTLPKLLGPAGYVSHQSGKWWEGNACRCGGFTEGMTAGDPDKKGRHGDEGLKIGREGMKPVFDFIDKAKAQKMPFFAWYAPMMPHQPHTPPERLLAKYKDKTPSIHVAKYWAMCEWFDETIGELLKKLDDTGLAKDTIVVYLHDNGWIQDPNAAKFAPKSKLSPYDGGLRTPIVIRWPGHVTPGVSEALASSADLAPTILAACGVNVPTALPGINLLDAKAMRTQATGALFTHSAVDITKPAANLTHRWIVEGHTKLIAGKDGKNELYDLKTDPTEETDLATKQPQTVAAMMVKLNAWWDGK
jgi:arylsulfatase A-like enzyme